MQRELLIGCGARRLKLMHLPDCPRWGDLTTLDINPAHRPDVVHDLEVRPWPFHDDEFDEVHAYDVLEHLGQTGDYRSFFAPFAEIWRILRPGGFVFASVPHWQSEWAWGDPGHRRVITQGTLAFLSQDQYRKQVGQTSMCDYRQWYSADFDCTAVEHLGETFFFQLQAVKPARLEGRG